MGLQCGSCGGRGVDPGQPPRLSRSSCTSWRRSATSALSSVNSASQVVADVDERTRVGGTGSTVLGASESTDVSGATNGVDQRSSFCPGRRPALCARGSSREPRNSSWCSYLFQALERGHALGRMRARRPSASRGAGARPGSRTAGRRGPASRRAPGGSARPSGRARAARRGFGARGPGAVASAPPASPAGADVSEERDAAGALTRRDRRPRRPGRGRGLSEMIRARGSPGAGGRSGIVRDPGTAPAALVDVAPRSTGGFGRTVTRGCVASGPWSAGRSPPPPGGSARPGRGRVVGLHDPDAAPCAGGNTEELVASARRPPRAAAPRPPRRRRWRHPWRPGGSCGRPG